MVCSAPALAGADCLDQSGGLMTDQSGGLMTEQKGEIVVYDIVSRRPGPAPRVSCCPVRLVRSAAGA
jgi:hypothetical protein